MIDYDSEREHLIKYLKEKGGKSGEWNKWMGNLSAGAIKERLQPRLSGTERKVVGPNVYIERYPSEWDLLIVGWNAEPVDEAPTYNIKDVYNAIEIKTSAVKKEGIERYKKAKVVSEENPNIRFSFIRVLKGKKPGDLEEECFLLHKSGEWKRLIEWLRS